MAAPIPAIHKIHTTIHYNPTVDSGESQLTPECCHSGRMVRYFRELKPARSHSPATGLGMSAAKWYFSRDGVEQGPLSSSELRALARSGELLETDLLWKEGMEKWRPAGEAGRLFRDGDSRRHRRRRHGRSREQDSARGEKDRSRSQSGSRRRSDPRTEAEETSRFRAWALAVGCPAWLLEPIPVAGSVAVFFGAIWLIVWLLTLSSPDTEQMVKEVKQMVITEAGEAVNQAATAAKRSLMGEDGSDEEAATRAGRASPKTDSAGSVPPQATSPDGSPALGTADF